MRVPILLLLAGLASAFTPQGAGQPAAFDLVILRGTIIDGSGARRFTGDIGVIDGRIAAIGDLSARRTSATIDARGLFVTPGFINLHSHATSLGLRVAENMLSQGVTTEFLNADGGGALDIVPQLRMLDSAGLALNVGANIGFNSVWSTVVGNADRRPTADEIARMQKMIADNLENGAFSVSAGLDYKPGYYATEAEVVQVLEPARKWRTNFPNHDRVTPETKFSARAAVQETMRIGERAGLVPVVTHMKVSGRERGSARVILGQMRANTARGVYTAADVYPYLSGLTGLGALTIPAWAVDGGIVEFRKRIADPAQRQRIVAETDETIAARFTGPDGILVLSTRRRLSDYMKEFGTTSPGEAIVKIMETDTPSAILGFGQEDDLVKIMQYPAAAISCDCGATTGATGHPRNYGTFPRVLGRYVREQKALTWEDAIRKMTALPATISGLVDRGYLAVGMAADITVFDTATVIDHATFEEPGLKSDGIRHVVVNGQVAFRDGATTGVRAGRTLRREAWMPSRPMTSATTARRFSLRGRFTPVGETEPTHAVVIALTQAAGARRATGTFTSTSLKDGTVLAGKSYGVVQVAKGWTSVTGRSTWTPTNEERAFTLTVDQSDPHAAGSGRTVTFEVSGAPPVRGTIR
ncbi:MAG: amidohydrolase family protein [Cytophagaceae bacterium]|nr:amidohydrolase family protein [Gemmatimonadaceae bacterium]